MLKEITLNKIILLDTKNNENFKEKKAWNS